MTDETKLQQCSNCRNFSKMAAGTVCRLAPPQPLVIGMTHAQTAKGIMLNPNAAQAQVMPIIQGFYSPTADEAWCGQWRPRDFDGDRPTLPVTGKVYRT